MLLSEVEVCTVTLPEALRIPIPNGLSLDTLPEKIIDALGAAALNFVKALVNNPDALAKFIGIIAAKNAAKIGAKMLCRGLIDAAVDAAIDAAAGVVLEAAAEAGVGVGALLGGAAGVGIIGSAFGAIAGSNSSHGGQGSSSSSGQPGGANQDQNPAVPNLKSFTYANGNLAMGWTGVMFAADYRLKINKPDGTDLFNASVGSQTSKSIPFTEITPGLYSALSGLRPGEFYIWME